MSLLKLLLCFFPLGALCWTALACSHWAEDGAWPGRTADTLIKWINA